MLRWYVAYFCPHIALGLTYKPQAAQFPQDVILFVLDCIGAGYLHSHARKLSRASMPHLPPRIIDPMLCPLFSIMMANGMTMVTMITIAIIPLQSSDDRSFIT